MKDCLFLAALSEALSVFYAATLGGDNVGGRGGDSGEQT